MSLFDEVYDTLSGRSWSSVSEIQEAVRTQRYLKRIHRPVSLFRRILPAFADMFETPTEASVQFVLQHFSRKTWVSCRERVSGNPEYSLTLRGQMKTGPVQIRRDDLGRPEGPSGYT